MNQELKSSLRFLDLLLVSISFHTTLLLGAKLTTIIVTLTTTGGAVQHSVAKIRIKPGGKSRDHYHPVAEESYLILEGNGKVVLNGEEKLIAPGDNVAIVAKTRHQVTIPRIATTYFTLCINTYVIFKILTVTDH